MTTFQQLIATILILTFSAIAQAAETLNVVFDLDWTLIYPTSAEMKKYQPLHVIEVDGQLFRFSDYAVEVIRTLHETPGVQVSFFSGGTKQRNEQVVRALYQEMNEGRSNQFKPYLVLNKDHLQVISTDPDLKFWQRYQKDLNRYFDPDATILVDDMKELVPEKLRMSLLWLKKTYNDRPLFELASLEDPAAKKYSAPNFEEWQKERLKLVRALGLILTSRELVLKDAIHFDEALQMSLRLEGQKEIDPVRKGFRQMQLPLTCKSIHRVASSF